MEPLAHVLWIGGPPGTGKTSIARKLAAENDVRAYHSDAHTFAHHDRALALAFPATERWEAMSQEERWVLTPPDRMAEHSLELNAERFRLMLEDLRAFPPAPLIVAEGTPLLPSLVAPHLASAAHAVWLLPAPELERALLAGRPTTTFDATSDPPRAAENRIRRELLVAEAIEREAGVRGLRVLRVDGSRDLASMREAVEEAFRGVLERGPRATSREARRALRRDENRRWLRQILTYLEREPAAGRPDDAEYRFACECGHSACDRVVVTAVSEYARCVDRSEVLLHPSHARDAERR